MSPGANPNLNPAWKGSPASPAELLELGGMDLAGLQECDGLLAVLNGQVPDDGVAVAVGICTALGKPVFLFRDEGRKLSTARGSAAPELACHPLIYAGLPRPGWEGYIYDSMEQLGDPEKELAKWAREPPAKTGTEPARRKATSPSSSSPRSSERPKSKSKLKDKVKGVVAKNEKARKPPP